MKAIQIAAAAVTAIILQIAVSSSVQGNSNCSQEASLINRQISSIKNTKNLLQKFDVEKINRTFNEWEKSVWKLIESNFNQENPSDFHERSKNELEDILKSGKNDFKNCFKNLRKWLKEKEYRINFYIQKGLEILSKLNSILSSCFKFDSQKLINSCINKILPNAVKTVEDFNKIAIPAITNLENVTTAGYDGVWLFASTTTNTPQNDCTTININNNMKKKRKNVLQKLQE